MVFFSLSRHIPGYYLEQAMSVSFQILSNLSFIDHPSTLGCESVVKQCTKKQIIVQQGVSHHHPFTACKIVWLNSDSDRRVGKKWPSGCQAFRLSGLLFTDVNKVPAFTEPINLPPT
jgi:hypothetical protein